MFAANKIKNQSVRMPRACPVEIHVCCYLASNVSLHGSRPWHPILNAWDVGVATIVKFHGTSPWHLYSINAARGIFVQSTLNPRFLNVSCSNGSISPRIASLA